MIHEELLEKIDYNLDKEIWFQDMGYALRAVVELHKPIPTHGYENYLGGKAEKCELCLDVRYPCPTIQAIEKEL